METGIVVAFAGDTEPKGWAFCDGRSVSKDSAEYKALFQVIGAIHGGDANPKFQLPDYRGLFLRGVNHNAGRDPDAGTRTAPGINNTGNSGDQVGSIQADEFKQHSHPLHYASANLTSIGAGSYSNIDPVAHAAQDNGAMVARGGAETRPKNAYVNYLIKL